MYVYVILRGACLTCVQSKYLLLQQYKESVPRYITSEKYINPIWQPKGLQIELLA